MSRARYWKLAADEVGGFSYDEAKLVNWDIKCVVRPEEDAVFVGVFMYRDGTPLDYESVRGLTYYHNHIPRGRLPGITKFLRDRFGGDQVEKGERIFLRGSREIYSGPDISRLASELEGFLDARATITLEFSGAGEEELASAGLPAAKLLPIPS